MSSGSTSPSAVLPLNRYGQPYSLVEPESTTAADQRYLQTTSTVAAPTLATQGVPTRSADSVVLRYSHNGNGSSDGAAQGYAYYTPQAAWVLVADEAAATSWAIKNTATQKSGTKTFDVQGADRVYVAVSSLPSHASAATLDIWLLGRSAPPVTGV